MKTSAERTDLPFMSASPHLSSPATTADAHANANRWAVSSVLGAGLVLAAVFVVIWGPTWALRGLEAAPATKAALESQWRTALIGALLAGVFAWCGVQLSINFKAMSRVLEQGAATQAASERSAYFAAQAGETARYANAMALLGHDSLEVRLGGIYALERLARESRQDHGPIMEVLAAFVRSHAAWVEGEEVTPRLSADIQAVLSVLGRRAFEFDPEGQHVDLHGTALARGYMPFAQLAGAFLYEANLEGAVLQSADLRGAWLWRARLTNAVLEGAHLEGADLTGTSGVTLAQLQSAHLDETTKLPEGLRSEFDWSAPKSKADSATQKTPELPTKSSVPPSDNPDLRLPSLRRAA